MQPRSLADLARWHAARHEPALGGDLPIVDAHHHMWDRPPESYQLPELMAELQAGHDVRGTVFVECNAMYRAAGPVHLRPVGETEYVNGVAAASASGLYGRQRLCAGIVGFADLCLGAPARAVLEAHISAGGGRFRGIRHQAQFDPVLGSMARRAAPEHLLLDPAFRSGFAELAPLGLSFDAWIFFTQIDELIDLARTYPETSIVLNHGGAPLGIGPYAGRREEVFTVWADAIRRLAQCDNVTVKIGGLGMLLLGFGFEAQPEPPDSVDLAAAWRPYVETLIDAFGPGRAMFESNFPVDKQSYSYVAGWNAFKRLTASCSAAERHALFAGTAVRVYRLEGLDLEPGMPAAE
jgi:predicted TIM-barrel fold metal-dependent hydrolase